jgi:hypothetical protein
MANDDNELSEYLVGTWTEVQESPGLVVTLSHTHHKDGSWMLEASANYDGAATLKNSATGTWRVEDGCLITTVEKSDVEVMQTGDTFQDDILIAVDGELHLMVGTTGETTVRTKIAD